MSEPSAASDKEKLVLVLQGGGALGAYQAGAYEALDEADLLPDWVAGISIGAINAAIIAGNPPDARVRRLRAFWEQASSWLQGDPALEGTQYREMFNYMSAAAVSTVGVPGFFEPRIPPASVMPPGSLAALSVYDSAPLKATLEELVNFPYIEQKRVRLSVGAVNVRTGNFAYFDLHDHVEIAPEHIMASGALPPGLPPVMIEGEPYWDGGLVSNTPLQYILDYTDDDSDKCIFQLDLFSARGPCLRTLLEVAQREKEIRYSSRTRLNTEPSRRRKPFAAPCGVCSTRCRLRRSRTTRLGPAAAVLLRLRRHHRAPDLSQGRLRHARPGLRVLPLLGRRALAGRPQRHAPHPAAPQVAPAGQAHTGVHVLDLAD